jgi:uncharacterized OB-fold protein
MKCSKCGYVGFETADRCRYCGYEFSLSNDCDLTDFTIHRDDDPRDLDDSALVDAAVAPSSSPTFTAAIRMSGDIANPLSFGGGRGPARLVR